MGVEVKLNTNTDMIIQLVFVFIATVGSGALADATFYKSYSMQQVHLTPQIRSEFAKLNRYCRPSYGYSSYRPSSGFNLGSLIGPAVFGLAALGGFAALSGLLSGANTAINPAPAG